MDIIPFRDYSDALIPIPALPTGRSDTDSPSSPAPSRAFRNELDNRLQSDETPAESIERETGPLFDLASPMQRPSRPVTPFTASAQIEQTSRQPEDDELMMVCREIEGLLLSILLKNLGEQSFGDTIFSKSWESSVYKDMFFTEMAKSIGGTSPGLGIADVLYNDIIMKAGGQLDQLA